MKLIKKTAMEEKRARLLGHWALASLPGPSSCQPPARPLLSPCSATPACLSTECLEQAALHFWALLFPLRAHSFPHPRRIASLPSNLSALSLNSTHICSLSHSPLAVLIELVLFAYLLSLISTSMWQCRRF